MKEGDAIGVGIRTYLNGEIEIGSKIENERGRDMNHGLCLDIFTENNFN